MAGINEVNSKTLNNNLQKDVVSGREGKGSNKVTSAKNVESPADQTNKLLIELHIEIKVESKNLFEVQAGSRKLLDRPELDLSQLKINGRPITDLTQDEAKQLVSEDGFLGVKNTAKRIFEFAVNAAGDNVERLKIARDAIIKGFKEAEEMFGGKLPDISYDTYDTMLEMMDGKIRDLGGSVVDVTA